MKTITRSIICLPMAAMILTAALAIPAAAQKQVPFKGTLQGRTHVSQPASTDHYNRHGNWHASGQFSFTQDLTLNFLNFTVTGSAQWIAANGDMINTMFRIGYTRHVVFTVTEIHTITGGTGRFTGAQGIYRAPHARRDTQ